MLVIYEGTRQLAEHTMNDFEGCPAAYNYLDCYIANFSEDKDKASLKLEFSARDKDDGQQKEFKFREADLTEK